MRLGYDAWVIRQLTERRRCRVEKSMTCIPLRNDPICKVCFDTDRLMEAVDAQGH